MAATGNKTKPKKRLMSITDEESTEIETAKVRAKARARARAKALRDKK